MNIRFDNPPARQLTAADLPLFTDVTDRATLVFS